MSLLRTTLKTRRPFPARYPLLTVSLPDSNFSVERPKRAIADPPTSQGRTTAHPIENKSRFLETTTTPIPETKKTRIPYKNTLSKDSGDGSSKLFKRDWTRLGLEYVLFAAPGLGMLVFFWPVTLLCKFQGSRVIIGFSLLISAFLILLQPSVLNSNIWIIVIVRALQGVTCSSTLSVIGKNAANWATLKEQLFFVSISFGSILFAPGIYWLLSIRILAAQTTHLALLHYFLASSTLITALLWILFYRDDPQSHRWVNGIELNRIVTGKTQQQNRVLDTNVIPLLLKSYSTWSVLLAAFAYFSAIIFFATFLPIYLLKVLKFEKLCALTSITFLAPAFVHLFSVIFDKMLSGCSAKLKANFFNSFAFIVSAIFLFVLAAIPPNEHFAYNSKWILMVSLMPIGFTSLGFLYHAVVYGRYFTQYIISAFQIPLGLALAWVPGLVLFLTVNNETKFWRLSILIFSALFILGALIFGVLSRGQPARWAEHSWDPSNEYKMKDFNPIIGTEECGLLSIRKIDEPQDSNC
ncbi:unnamed protein product [Bursaphelenchus xylophilus]|uniref:(pine wood nematode) hypothetical protein n=1 Tax=Bursaphelenchus xylophilus TaxID=6326 RepID=A0A7I8WW38_BURXY|nr:unnamed protein product [Bursaphelenchus xylophilus]CAG9098462.1 unnamed protein product [Bursaphelenchus xylophilus]